MPQFGVGILTGQRAGRWVAETMHNAGSSSCNLPRRSSMSKPRHRATIPGGSADDVEAAFYEALQTGNLDQLMACWADEEEIVCVHPSGGPRLVGAAAIRASFENMFIQGTISAKPSRVRRVSSFGLAVHSVVEQVTVMTPDGIQEVWIVATNVYIKIAEGWRMVAHHATAGRNGPVENTMPGQLLH